MPPVPILDEILANLDRLPEVPYVALQVNQLMDDPEVRAQDLAKVIMMDPSLTSRVLRLCNSAEYGFSRKIGTISEAVSILGSKELKRIIFTIISHGFLNRPVEGYALEKGALWDNALACAVYARYIAKKLNFNDPELVFVAALLRDIGKIALETYLEGRGSDLQTVARDSRVSFAEAEEQLVGASHTVVGAELASRWNLPDSLILAISYHHQPSQIPPSSKPDDKKLVAIIHLADTFTMMSGCGVGLDGLMYPLDAGVFNILGIGQDGGMLDKLYAEVLMLQDEVKAMTSSFDGAKG